MSVSLSVPIHPWGRCFICGKGVDGVEVQKHIDEQEHEEGDAEEEKDVGDMRDVSAGQQRHLLLGGAHEKEPGCVKELFGHALVFAEIFPRGEDTGTYEWSQILEAVDVLHVTLIQ